uniref:c-type cytochrome n=1 Tax=Campylobacter jejuni TaxID=197 RepID=UPI003F497D41
GEDGKGHDGMFPDLTKYGPAAFVVDAFHSGKAGFIGTMPKFPTLNDLQKEAVSAFLISLFRVE